MHNGIGKLYINVINYAIIKSANWKFISTINPSTKAHNDLILHRNSLKLLKNKYLHAGKQIKKRKQESTQLCRLVLIAANMMLIFDVINIQNMSINSLVCSKSVTYVNWVCWTLFTCRFFVAFIIKELNWNLWNKSIWIFWFIL